MPFLSSTHDSKWCVYSLTLIWTA